MFKVISEMLNNLGFNATLLIGGAIGGVIGLKKDRPFWHQLITVVASAFIANYTTPVIISIFNMDPSTTSGIGFIVGYTNKGLLEYAIERLKKK